MRKKKKEKEKKRKKKRKVKIRTRKKKKRKKRRRRKKKKKSKRKEQIRSRKKKADRRRRRSRLTFSVALCPHAETVRTIRDGETRTATSTFTQLLSSDPTLLLLLLQKLFYVHRDRKNYWGRGDQDGHLDFHTAPELCPHPPPPPSSKVVLRPQRS